MDPELPPQRQELATALRTVFSRFEGLSMRTWAVMNAYQPSSVCRYLSGRILPPEEFIEDLVESSDSTTAGPVPGELNRLRELLYAAQDTSSGTWTYKKRLVERARRAQEQAATALQHNNELQGENTMLRRRLDEALRSAVEADALADARERITALELECSALRAQLPRPVSKVVEVLSPKRGYWDSYAATLAMRGWTPPSVLSVESTANAIMERLPAPSAPSHSRVKGVVNMMPQTGKTTSVIATVAKAADAGYRLIIVFAGPTDLIRRQLQARLDSDLPALPGTPGIARLTDQVMDYRRVHSRLSQLEFEKKDPSQPFNAPANLDATPARLLVVKRNAAVLRKLRQDLEAVGGALSEVPALVIDSESSAAAGGIVDRLVDDLVNVLPRADYVAFSSQPLITGLWRSPDGPPTPTDFIINPPQPMGYLGSQDFFDSDDASTSNAAARIRRATPGRDGLREALDMFVLTGAMKCYRQARTGTPFRQHLMLVGTIGLSNEKCKSLLAELRELWNEGGYDREAGRARLRDLFTGDVLPTSHSLVEADPTPESFDELLPHVRTTLDRASAPLFVSADDIPTEPLWATVVAGKAIEHIPNDGLTILYAYTTNQRFIEPVMRLTGKLFGFRTGYADLVRLYLPLPEADSTEIDIYPALAGSWQAESELLDDLKRYTADPN
jgi:hypothetical protein